MATRTPKITLSHPTSSFSRSIFATIDILRVRTRKRNRHPVIGQADSALSRARTNPHGDVLL